MGLMHLMHQRRRKIKCLTVGEYFLNRQAFGFK